MNVILGLTLTLPVSLSARFSLPLALIVSFTLPGALTVLLIHRPCDAGYLDPLPDPVNSPGLGT